jgi:bifunctional DNA primase/polymerase-like protein
MSAARDRTMSAVVAVNVALDYAAAGWQVFPLQPRSKVPAIKGGFHAATTNPATIRRWFGGAYPYNIAVATGLAAGVFVLDVDGVDGVLSVERLERQHGPLPRTRTSMTANGSHLWFRTTIPIMSSVGEIAAGLDARADRASCIAPPSIHPDGPTYKWVDESVPLAAAPEWLISLTRKKPSSIVLPTPTPPRRWHNGGPGAYGAAALDREIEALAAAEPGTRNHALNSASFSLHQLVAGGELDGAEVERRLIEAACANGLMTDPGDGPLRVMATIRSGARAGLQHPRSRPATRGA